MCIRDSIKTVFTIHNIAYQGKYGTDILEDTCGIGRRDQHIVEYDGCANFMKGAFETADKITTVSPTYAPVSYTHLFFGNRASRFFSSMSFRFSSK